MLLQTEHELLLHPRSVEIVDGGQAQVAHDVAADDIRALVFSEKPVEIGVGGAAREQGREVAPNLQANIVPVEVRLPLVGIARQHQVQVLAHILRHRDGAGVEIILLGVVRPEDLKSLWHHGRIRDGQAAAGAADHSGGAVELTGGRNVDETVGVGERRRRAEGELVGEQPLAADMGGFPVLEHYVDRGRAKRAVGDRAVDAAHFAAGIVNPAGAVARDGR